MPEERSEPTIEVDSDWKAEAAREKQKLIEAAKKTAGSGGRTDPAFVELLNLLAKRTGWSRRRVARAVARSVNLSSEIVSNNPDDPGSATFTGIEADDLFRMRMGILAAIEKTKPAGVAAVTPAVPETPAAPAAPEPEKPADAPETPRTMQTTGVSMIAVVVGLAILDRKSVV